MRLFIVLVSLVMVGCNGPSYKLEDRWLPLERIQQTTDKLIADNTTTTIGDTCFCNDLKQWLLDYPPGSVEFEAILLHERVHSTRQGSFAGKAEAWLADYVLNTKFRWEEEQLGWKEEITHLVQNGRYVNPQEVAIWLNKNYSGPVGGRMVSFEVALAWVQATITAAQQTPPPTRSIRPH
jgi:hypothetical protein